MNLVSKKRIVLLGMMSKIPVAGVVWQTLHYLIGFQRLGYDVYYVEAHGITPTKLMRPEETCDPSAKASAFIADVMHRFDLDGRWAFHALHGDGRCYGLSEIELKELYASADLIINLHGGTIPLPEHSATGRLVYLETDPVELQVELHDNNQETIDFLSPHCAFFTFGENYGNADCKLPVSERFNFIPTRQPIVMDFWHPYSNGAGATFTTIGNWQQPHRQVSFNGEVYHWSKHYEFLKFIDLPQRTNQPFELALASYSDSDQLMLEGKGWGVRRALSFSLDIDAYRDYIATSRGEFTVAKDQNVRLRTGWFSDRSATYLATGRPVITQDTGFGSYLPTGEGLFAFSTIKDAEAAVEQINSDYKRHSRAAHEIAREYLSYEVVLGNLLAVVAI
ncbi:MAG: glycosyltransferase [Acidobacteriota bacterium]